MLRLRHIFVVCCLLILANTAFAGVTPVVRVALSRYPLQVVEMAMDDYLFGVLAAELPKEWPLEAQKAQAIAARTYALYRKAHPQHAAYDLEASVNDQAFRMLDEYPSKLVTAVRTTRGQTLMWQGNVIPAFFHSCCGGRSEQAANVWTWAKQLTFYTAKADPFCRACPDQGWEIELSKAELSLMLQDQRLASGEVSHVIPINDEDSQRVHEVAIITDAETVALNSNRFRQLLGYSRVRSTNFNILELNEQLILVGSGNGHGVGLCQWGARGMADRGRGYREILNFYYPGVEIKRSY